MIATMRGRIDYPSVIGTTLLIAGVLFSVGIGLVRLFAGGIAWWPVVAGAALLVSIAGSAVALRRFTSRPVCQENDKPLAWWVLPIGIAATAVLIAFMRAGLDTVGSSLLREEARPVAWGAHFGFGFGSSTVTAVLCWIWIRRKAREARQGPEA